VVDIAGRAFPVKPIYLESVLELTNYELPKNDKDLCFVPPKKSKDGGGRRNNNNNDNGKLGSGSSSSSSPVGSAAVAKAGLLPDEEPPAKENLASVEELKLWYPSLKPRALAALKGMAHEKLNVELLMMLLGKVCGGDGASSNPNIQGNLNSIAHGGGNQHETARNRNNKDNNKKRNAKVRARRNVLSTSLLPQTTAIHWIQFEREQCDLESNYSCSLLREPPRLMYLAQVVYHTSHLFLVHDI
jgi:hypothetical protein